MQKSTMNARRDFLAADFDIRVSGHRLRARKLVGSRDDSLNPRPTLVFLHEGLGCIELWRDFPLTLADATGCDALIYDRWGHGRSDPLDVRRNPRYLHEEAFDSLPEVLAQCEIDDAILIGHSDGGSIALMFAAENRELVRGLITEAAHVFVEEITLEGIRETVKTYETTDLKQKLSRYHDENTELLFRGWCDTWLSPEFREWNIEEYLPKITCAALVIQGVNDEYATKSQVEGITRQVSGPASSLLIPNCGHVPHQQARAIVVEAMARFILTICGSTV